MTENAFVRNFFCPETRRITFESRMHMDLTSGAISFKKYIYIYQTKCCRLTSPYF